MRDEYKASTKKRKAKKMNPRKILKIHEQHEKIVNTWTLHSRSESHLTQGVRGRRTTYPSSIAWASSRISANSGAGISTCQQWKGTFGAVAFVVAWISHLNSLLNNHCTAGKQPFPRTCLNNPGGNQSCFREYLAQQVRAITTASPVRAGLVPSPV